MARSLKFVKVVVARPDRAAALYGSSHINSSLRAVSQRPYPATGKLALRLHKQTINISSLSAASFQDRRNSQNA
jgi:hypothetical protein